MDRVTVAICGRKGGVGKTTVACALANLEAAKGRNVLALDLDPQGNFPMGLGTRPSGTGIADLLKGTHPSPSPVGRNGHLGVLSGGPELEGLAGVAAANFSKALKTYQAETVIIDCPPGQRQFEDLAVAAASHVLVCADPSAWAVVGALRVLAEQKSIGKKWAIVVSRWSDRRLLDRAVCEQLAGGRVPLFVVRQDSGLASVTQSGVILKTDLDKLRCGEDLRKIGEWCHE